MPVAVMVAPVIPAITDHEIERILEAAAEAGASMAAYVLLRLPYEVKDLFREWLAQHYPQRAEHVMSLVRDARGGRDNDPNFGSRMRGTGRVCGAHPRPLQGGRAASSASIRRACVRWIRHCSVPRARAPRNFSSSSEPARLAAGFRRCGNRICNMRS